MRSMDLKPQVSRKFRSRGGQGRLGSCVVASGPLDARTVWVVSTVSQAATILSVIFAHTSFIVSLALVAVVWT